MNEAGINELDVDYLDLLSKKDTKLFIKSDGKVE